MMISASVGESFAHAVGSAPVLLAAPVALAAGLVSFLSPCVLPLVPGYLSYMTGLSGADLAEPVRRAAPAPPARAASTSGTTVVLAPSQARALQSTVRTGRVLLGGSLFVLGFSAVFVSYGALFGGLGSLLVRHQAVVTRVLGVVTIGLGLAFVGGIPGLQREQRSRRPGGAAVAGVLPRPRPAVHSRRPGLPPGGRHAGRDPPAHPGGDGRGRRPADRDRSAPGQRPVGRTGRPAAGPRRWF